MVAKLGVGLFNPYQDEGLKPPILYKGNVYKPFLKGLKKKEKLILKLDKLNLDYLLNIKGMLKVNGQVEAYFYKYEEGKLLKKYLEDDEPFIERWKLIEEIFLTDKALVKEGLTYFDYHTANLVVNQDIKFLDIDSIIKLTSFNRERIKRYLLELIISIYINYDLTFNVDNTVYLGILSDFLNINCYEEIDIEKIINVLFNKNQGEDKYLKERIKTF